MNGFERKFGSKYVNNAEVTRNITFDSFKRIVENPNTTLEQRIQIMEENQGYARRLDQDAKGEWFDPNKKVSIFIGTNAFTRRRLFSAFQLEKSDEPSLTFSQFLQSILDGVIESIAEEHGVDVESLDHS